MERTGGSRIPFARLWSTHFLWCELVLVVVLWAAFLVWCLRYGGEAHVLEFVEERRATIYGVFAGLFGSLLGFAIAAEAIVLSLSGSDRLSIIRSSRHYPTLWRVFRWTIRTLAFATVAVLVALILDRDKEPWTLWLYVSAFFSLLAAIQLARTIWVLEQVVSVVSTPEPKNHSRNV